MLQNLQVLRAVAALLVVVHHFLLASRDFGEGKGIANFSHLAEIGACGVDLFFCISGFVMLSSIIRKNSFSAGSFVLGRLARIVPAYWIASTAFILLVALNHIQKVGLSDALAEPLFSVEYLLSSYFLIPAYNPESHLMQPFLAQGWTLSYELYFYMLLMFATVTGKMNLTRIFVFGSVFLIGGVLLFDSGSGMFGTFISNPIVLEFILGMFVFLSARKTMRFGKFAAILGLVLLAGTTFMKVDDRVIYWGVPAALVIYGFVALEGIIPAPSFLKSLGDASYSLYLTHGALAYIYGGLLKRGWFASATKQNLAILVGSVLSVLLALVFYRFVEKPLNSWLSERRVRAQPVSAA